MADLTATYIVHYMLACVLFLMAPFLSSLWLKIIFFAEAILHSALAYIVQHSDTHLIHYFNPAAPKARLAAIWFLGIANTARWFLAAKLFFGWDSPVYYIFMTFNGIINGFYLLYALFCTIRVHHRVRAKYFYRCMFASLAVLGAAFLYSFSQRNINHLHVRHDPRLLYSGITQILYALALFPGSRFAPEWLLGFLTIPLWMVLWVCAGHENVL